MQIINKVEKKEGEDNMTIVNKQVEKFEEGKHYVFIADKTQKDKNSWSDRIDGELVEFFSKGFGFAYINKGLDSIKNKLKPRLLVLPHFCYEVQL